MFTQVLRKGAVLIWHIYYVATIIKSPFMTQKITNVTPVECSPTLISSNNNPNVRWIQRKKMRCFKPIVNSKLLDSS